MSADEARAGVTFSHLDQALSDDTDITKRELVDYLDTMSERLVRVLADRPLSVIRVRPGSEPFMQKNLPKYAPDWIRSVETWAERSKRTVAYPVCDDRRTLLWLANQRAVEFHPTLYRIADDAHPTHLVLDIDPPEGAGFAPVVRAAHAVRQALRDVGLDAAIKTSGAKGVHLFVPVEGADREQAATASRAIAARAERLDPEHLTTAFVREEREGKVFLDSTRAGGATVAAAYSPRVRPGLPVSFPLPWDELDDADPNRHTIRTVPEQLGDADPWTTLMPAAQRIPQILLDEGHEIPVARVQAMHAGKRRKREQEQQQRDQEA